MDKPFLDESPLHDTIDRARSLAKYFQLLARQLEQSHGTMVGAGTVNYDPFMARKVVLRALADENNATATLLPQLADLARQLDKESLRQLAGFDREFASLCAARGWTLSGGFPSYTVEGFVTVSIDTDRSLAEAGGRQAASPFPTVVADLVATILEEARHSSFDPQVFIERLLSAYQMQACSDGVAFGQPVRVAAILPHLALRQQSDRFKAAPRAKYFADYTLEHFGWDLTRLLARSSPTLQVRGHRLQLLPTSFPKDALLVLQDGGTRYVGRLAFTDVHNDN